MLCIAVYNAWPELGQELTFIQLFGILRTWCCQPPVIILCITPCLQIQEWSCRLCHLCNLDTENDFPDLVSASSLNSLLVSEIGNYPWLNKRNTHTHMKSLFYFIIFFWGWGGVCGGGHSKIHEDLLTTSYRGPLYFSFPSAGSTHHWFQDFQKQKLIKKDHLLDKFT